MLEVEMVLTATSWPVLMSAPLNTSPYDPRPIIDVDDERLNKFVVRSAQFSGFLLDFLHFALVHGGFIETIIYLLI